MRPERRRFVAGPALAISVCALLSVMASVLNGFDLRRARPASGRRYGELALLLAPVMVIALLSLTVLRF